MKFVPSTMKHTPSTIQKDPVKGVKKSAKNCVPKKVNPKDMKKKKNTKKQVTNKVIPKDVKKSNGDESSHGENVKSTIKKSNGDESSHGENVKSTIKKYAIKKVIPKGKVNCQRMTPLRSRVASMNQSLETNFTKGWNDRQERRWKRRQNKILITIVKASSMLVSAMEEVTKLDEKPDKC